MNGLVGQLFRFAQASVLSAGMSLGVPIALHEGLGISERIAVLIGLITALMVNFVVQRSYVFKSDGSANKQAIKFLGFSVLSRSGEYLAFNLLFSIGINYIVALATVVTISAAIKFFVYRWVIFAPREP